MANTSVTSIPASERVLISLTPNSWGAHAPPFFLSNSLSLNPDAFITTYLATSPTLLHKYWLVLKFFGMLKPLFQVQPEAETSQMSRGTPRAAEGGSVEWCFWPVTADKT